MNRDHFSELETAFQHTDYYVHDGERWHTLAVGAPCPAALRSRLPHDPERGAWLVTAYNPQAQAQDEASNRQRNHALRQRLDAGGHVYLTSDSRARDGAWPTEPGVCLLDMPRPEAIALARDFDQAALLAIPRQGWASLVWL